MNELELKIKEVIPRTYNVKSFRLGVAEDIDFKAGQFMIISFGNGLNKPLSIASSPTEKGYIEFTKKITGSEFSKRLDGLKPGDQVSVRYPFGSFIFNGEYPKIAFLSGGIGITPVRSICRYVVDKKLDTDIILLYGNRTTRDIVFKADFDDMQGIKVVHIFSEPDSGWQERAGYINKEVIKEEVTDYNERKFFICGPPGMVTAMKRILQDELALPIEHIITENFIGY